MWTAVRHRDDELIVGALTENKWDLGERKVVGGFWSHQNVTCWSHEDWYDHPSMWCKKRRGLRMDFWNTIFTRNVGGKNLAKDSEKEWSELEGRF